MEVHDSVAVVTGGASGLGAGVVRTLVGRGARAVILDLPASKGAETAAQVGDAVAFVPVDVTDPGGVEKAVVEARDVHGRMDVLVSCAGISSGQRVVGRDGVPKPLEHFRRHIEVNLIGLFDVIRHAASAMSANQPNAEGERGLIINIASIAGYEGQVGQSAYGSSKAGVIGLTLPLARDLAPWGIRVMTIAPGTMDTPMLANLDGDFITELVAGNIFPHRLGTPADVGALVAHFMENTFLNGEVVRLDAGLRLATR
ncbi:SDR family NAD(P)-dependent oxidoreductase [Candidatus Poriferisocius sp.]|uniref:SDR family NAD(P)-dependent oxidoreductase n=1 Tax=Candidatus Poriferisocius sp. TaxID=3101276 RepID=UPI003B01FDC8